MFSRIQSKLGTAGLVVAIVALVAALGGGAYAAQLGLNSKQKKEVKNISKQVAKPGPEGKQGPAGPGGAKGDTGAKGDNGAPGTNGTNGTDGEDGMCTAGNPACELPSGSELVGVWSTSGGLGKEDHADISLTPISFNVRISPAPTALWAFEVGGFTFGAELHDGSASIYGCGAGSTFCPGIEPESLAAAEAVQEAWEEACPGNADAPEAAPGFLCIYNEEIEGATGPYSHGPLAEAANEYGIVVPWFVFDGKFAKGSWAVTAE
jgi:hypothetical protein